MHVTKTLIGVLDWGLSAEDAIALPNLFFGQQGVLIEDDAAGKAIAAKMQPFGYAFTPTELGSKLNAAQRVDGVWHGAADPRGPGSASVDGSPPQG
jgi:gamma-glutamyltranspeptidase/glutathione hydrolase